MSAIHRVDDIRSMPGPKFFEFAWRLPCYAGVMRERVLAEQREKEQPSQPQQQPVTYRQQGNGQRHTVPATKAALQSDPAFKGIFSFGGSANA